MLGRRKTAADGAGLYFQIVCEYKKMIVQKRCVLYNGIGRKELHVICRLRRNTKEADAMTDYEMIMVLLAVLGSARRCFSMVEPRSQ